MKTENRPACLLCGREGAVLYSGLHDRLFGAVGVFGERRCVSCGLIWLDPRPVEGDLPRCYKRYFTHAGLSPIERESPGRSPSTIKQFVREMILCGYFGYRTVPMRYGWLLAGRILGRIPFLKYRATYGLGDFFPRHSGSPGLVVDVGCGRGDAIRSMRSCGVNVLGVEPDPAAARFLADTGVPHVNATLEKAALEAGSASDVLMINVIEHVSDPLSTIRECHRILRKGGRLVMRTPNRDSLGYRLFGRDWLHLDAPRHLFIFSPRTIRRLMASCGFERVVVRAQPNGARYAFDASAMLTRLPSLPATGPKPQRGRTVFALVEHTLCALGLTVGEDMEIVAYK